MRILFTHPNYRSGEAEIAGKGSPAGVAYLAGYLKAHGYGGIRFIDAMTDNLPENASRAELAAETPAICKAERALQIAKEAHPDVVTALGGAHDAFMCRQALFEALWIDAVARGEWPASRGQASGVAYAEPPIRDVDAITPDWEKKELAERKLPVLRGIKQMEGETRAEPR